MWKQDFKSRMFMFQGFEKQISLTFYEQLFHQFSFAKKLQCQTVIREKLPKALLNEKKWCVIY